ncbi:MAG: hypothetical protein IPJ88_15785 [Myxococcales bacterium]|nr:MAG: hypothetical protein IPJ88_15785 [Myxococcales bacterium]
MAQKLLIKMTIMMNPYFQQRHTCTGIVLFLCLGLLLSNCSAHNEEADLAAEDASAEAISLTAAVGFTFGWPVVGVVVGAGLLLYGLDRYVDSGLAAENWTTIKQLYAIDQALRHAPLVVLQEFWNYVTDSLQAIMATSEISLDDARLGQTSMPGQGGYGDYDVEDYLTPLDLKQSLSIHTSADIDLELEKPRIDQCKATILALHGIITQVNGALFTSELVTQLWYGNVAMLARQAMFNPAVAQVAEGVPSGAFVAIACSTPGAVVVGADGIPGNRAVLLINVGFGITGAQPVTMMTEASSATAQPLETFRASAAALPVFNSDGVVGFSGGGALFGLPVIPSPIP